MHALRGVALVLLFSLAAASVLGQSLSKEEYARLAVDIDAFLEGTPDLVLGNRLSLTEKALFSAIMKEQPRLADLGTVKDSQATLSENNVVLIGGTRTNEFYGTATAGTAVRDETRRYGAITVRYLVLEERKVLVVKSAREDENFPLTGIAKSPLARLLPPPLVPVAASLLSVLLLLFLKFLGGTAAAIGKTAASILAGTYWKKRYNEGEAKRHLRFHVVDLPLRELTTIALVILVLSLAKTWAFSPPWWQVFKVVLVTTAVLTMIREGARILLAKKRRIHVESVFWPAGALLTLLSAYLGTLFSLPSYLRIRKDERKEWGAVSLRVSWLTMLVAFLAWLANLVWASPYYQTLSVLAATVAFIGLLPIPPLAGVTILKRSKLAWCFAFLIAFPLYVLVAFLSAYF